jgi:ADP-ribose pyrophosphatase YjhB (NUDIX family)
MDSPYRGWVTSLPSHLAVGAIVRRGSDILLVSEHSPDEPEPVWALPGGQVAAGEPVGTALHRRVADETGLSRVRPGRLLWLARYTVSGEAFETLGFEVLEGSPYATKSVNRAALLPPAEWVPVEEAVTRLSRMWFAPIREPAVAYLTDRAVAATLWSWSKLDERPHTVPEVAVRDL